MVFLLELFFLFFAVTLLVVAFGRQSVKSFSFIFTSIILKALPFMLFGSLIGGLVEIFVSRERMTALLPKKHPWLAVFIAAGMGLVPLPAQIAFLLTGPMFDLKLLLMYQSLFRKRAIAVLAGFILIIILAGIHNGRKPAMKSSITVKQHGGEQRCFFPRLLR